MPFGVQCSGFEFWRLGLRVSHVVLRTMLMFTAEDPCTFILAGILMIAVVVIFCIVQLVQRYLQDMLRYCILLPGEAVSLVITPET